MIMNFEKIGVGTVVILLFIFISRCEAQLTCDDICLNLNKIRLARDDVCLDRGECLRRDKICSHRDDVCSSFKKHEKSKSELLDALYDHAYAEDLKQSFSNCVQGLSEKCSQYEKECSEWEKLCSEWEKCCSNSKKSCLISNEAVSAVERLSANFKCQC